MPEMRKRSADSHGEDRAEGGATVLGMFGVSEVPNDAEFIDTRECKHRDPPQIFKEIALSRFVHWHDAH